MVKKDSPTPAGEDKEPLPLGYKKVNEGILCEVTGYTFETAEECALFFDVFCPLCQTSDLKFHLQRVSNGECSDPYAMYHCQAIQGSRHKTYVQPCVDDDGLYLLDHRTLQIRPFPSNSGDLDKTIVKALEAQWMDWWQDKPSSGGFELCKLSRSVWDKVRGYIVKIQEKRKQTKPLRSIDADDAPRTPDTATSIHSGRADGNSGTKKGVDDGKDSNQLKVSATATYSGRADGTGGTQRGVGDTVWLGLVK